MVILNIDRINGTIQELTKRQNSLMIKNHHEIGKQYMEHKVVNQHYKYLKDEMDWFLFNDTSFLTLIPILK